MDNKRSLRVTPGQLALLHVAKRDLCLDDENYRSILRHYKVETGKDLNMADFEQLMKYLESLGFKSSTPHNPLRAPRPDADGLPYPAQLHKIETLFKQLDIPAGARQQGFCHKVIKKPWPQTRGEANKIIEGLKAMLERRDIANMGKGKGSIGRRKRLGKGGGGRV
jgi:phage gp16-like protein